MDFFSNTFDIVIIVVVVFLGLRGFLSGFLKELASAIGVIGGIYLSAKFSHFISKFLSDKITFFAHSETTNFVSFMIGLIIFMILSKYIIMVLANVIFKYEGLSSIDRFGGIIMSLIKNFVFISIVVFSFSNIDFIKKGTAKYVQGSKVYPISMKIGAKLVGDIVSQISKVK